MPKKRKSLKRRTSLRTLRKGRVQLVRLGDLFSGAKTAKFLEGGSPRKRKTGGGGGGTGQGVHGFLDGKETYP